MVDRAQRLPACGAHPRAAPDQDRVVLHPEPHAPRQVWPAWLDGAVGGEPEADVAGVIAGNPPLRRIGLLELDLAIGRQILQVGAPGVEQDAALVGVPHPADRHDDRAPQQPTLLHDQVGDDLLAGVDHHVAQPPDLALLDQERRADREGVVHSSSLGRGRGPR